MMDKIETPDLSHLNSTDYENVYEPAEDSFLMLDALESEIPFIKSLKPTICLEIGSGSGIVLTGLAKCLGSCCAYFSIDINPHAAQVTRKTACKNSVCLEVVNCDLVGPLLPQIQNKVDVLVFNPPYVPTDENEIDPLSPIALSWAGGFRGRTVMDRLFPLIPQIMSPSGVFYLLIVKENDEEDILNVMKSLSWRGSVIIERKAGREFLKVLKFERVKV
ncbi:methyltransferase N6AMT1-like isoform X1 [Daphnia pulicaria]|uniref:methyltransferase N6AMT1-like isoform X1 n=1 Tax=Daphnia pulicaria TaxID=35523 RepID=UPI001EECBEFD|nr:methyltransferase N6AMT1-like isoform X1 [Daphnia pulicaria]